MISWIYYCLALRPQICILLHMLSLSPGNALDLQDDAIETPVIGDQGYQAIQPLPTVRLLLEEEIKTAIIKLGGKELWQSQSELSSYEYQMVLARGTLVSVRLNETGPIMIAPDFSKDPDARCQQLPLLFIRSATHRLYALFDWQDNRAIKLKLMERFNENYIENLEGKLVVFIATRFSVRIAGLDIPFASVV